MGMRSVTVKVAATAFSTTLTCSGEQVAWLIGLWLGMGECNTTGFVVNDSDTNLLFPRVEQAASACGLDVGLSPELRDSRSRMVLTSRAGTHTCGNVFYHVLDSLGMLCAKEVSEETSKVFMAESLAVRRALVAGLIDSAGHLANRASATGVLVR